MTAFGAAGAKHATATGCFHLGAESILFGAATDVWLICTFRHNLQLP